MRQKSRQGTEQTTAGSTPAENCDDAPARLNPRAIYATDDAPEWVKASPLVVRHGPGIIGTVHQGERDKKGTLWRLTGEPRKRARSIKRIAIPEISAHERELKHLHAVAKGRLSGLVRKKNPNKVVQIIRAVIKASPGARLKVIQKSLERDHGIKVTTQAIGQHRKLF